MSVTGRGNGTDIPGEDVTCTKKRVMQIHVWKVTQSCQTLCNPMDCSLPGSSIHEILQARILELLAFLFSKGSSQFRSPALHANSLLSEPPGNPKKTGVGSLSLLQWIFPTQESNRHHLHCRQILYQLS